MIPCEQNRVGQSFAQRWKTNGQYWNPMLSQALLNIGSRLEMLDWENVEPILESNIGSSFVGHWIPILGVYWLDIGLPILGVYW